MISVWWLLTLLPVACIFYLIGVAVSTEKCYNTIHNYREM